MDIRFDGKIVIITGASTGIGCATALEFAKSGAIVVVNYNKSKDAAQKVVNTIVANGGSAIAVQADVSKASDVKRLVQVTLDTYHNRIDILVNNAGSLLDRRPFQEMTEQLWDDCMALNLKSIYLVSHAVVPIMKQQKYGRIINVTSIAARNGGGFGAGHYSAAKAGVLTFTKSMAKELAKTGITVNAVAPGVITTPFHDHFTSKELRESFKDMVPLGREGGPEEIAYSILFLASHYAEYILGETLEINGGLLMD
jgi:3-oxoacyl-[acyl-carrier protein] reductase